MIDDLGPIVKWVGGKSQLLKELVPLLPKHYDDYCEPFLGGGALAFHLQRPSALLNDINQELISLYTVIRDDVDALIDELSGYRNDSDFFYKTRNLDRNKKAFEKLSPVKKAARTYYLNRMCYNGLYRVNKKGLYNVPFGRYAQEFAPKVNSLKALNLYLNLENVRLSSMSYDGVLNHLSEKSFDYLDPPYDPLSPSSSFTSYATNGFDREDQEKLRDFCVTLDNHHIRFMLSNSKTDFILGLYQDFKIRIIKAHRFINSNSLKRGYVDEVVVTSY